MEEFNHIDPNEPVIILNIAADDFTLEVADIHNKGKSVFYTVRARESLKLPRYAANHVSERLAQKIESTKSGVLTQANHKLLLDQIRMYSTPEL